MLLASAGKGGVVVSVSSWEGGTRRMGSRKDRKERANKRRSFFEREMATAMQQALDEGKTLTEVWEVGACKELELEKQYPDQKQLVTQAAANFISVFRQSKGKGGSEG
jgi:chromosome condensin MukBEF ATPase and DNA-binding subunit MukB